MGKVRDAKNARAMKSARQEERENPRKVREQRRANKTGFCNAKKRDGSKCRNAKGKGTQHPGVGRCSLHGGTLTNNIKSAAAEQAVLMGAPKEINPVDALYWCIKITAGEVEWLTDSIAELDEMEWYEDSILGKQMNLLVRERKEAVTRLANFSSQAIKIGLAERAVRLAENYGVALSKLLKGVLDDLELSPYQQQLAPMVVRKHLILLEGSSPVSEEDRKPLPALNPGKAA